MPRTLRTRAQLTEASQPPPAMSSRPRRTATTQQKLRDSSPQATVTVARNSSTSPVDGRNSIRLTVKMPPSKLREATSGSRVKSVGLSSRDSLEPAEVVSGPRSSRAKRSVVIDSGSEDDDDDEDEDDDGEDEEDDAQGEEDEGEEEEEVEEGDEEEGAEEEDEEDEEAEGDEEEEQDAEGESDVEMQDADAPPPPVIQRTGPPSKPRLVVTAPTKEPLESVEAKEMRIANNVDSDEDLSELPDEDAEGEDIVEDDAMIDGEDDAEGDSDEDLSRDGTPDITKLTKRQRGRMGDASDEHFMSLNMGMFCCTIICSRQSSNYMCLGPRALDSFKPPPKPHSLITSQNRKPNFI